MRKKSLDACIVVHCVHGYFSRGDSKDCRSEITDPMLIWITGQSGAGKTTLGQNLASKYGFAHYDGDVYYCGGDPVADAGSFIGREGASYDLKEQWGIVETNYGKLFAGEDVPVEEWIPALEPLCRSVAETYPRHQKDMAVTFSIYTRSVRQWARARIEELLLSGNAKAACPIHVKFVVLNDVDGAAAKRKLVQVKSAAEAEGMTMEEFVGQYGKEWKGEEETLKELSKSRLGFEAGDESLEEYDVNVREDEDADIVMEKVAKLLDLAGK